MNEDNDERFQSSYSTRTWRGCCVVPVVSIVAILVLALAAGLFDRPTNRPDSPGTAQTSKNRLQFIEFGQTFFAIAQTADKINEQAFEELDKFTRQQRSARSLKSAFARASMANRRAAEKYKNLDVPSALSAQKKCREAVDKIAESFTARRNACEAVIQWADDPNDKQIAQRYARHAQDVTTLTQAGLTAFADAAKRNGVTDQDAHEFLPQALQQSMSQFGMLGER